MRSLSVGLVVVGIAALVGLFMVSGATLAEGSGYNLSYTAPADSSIIASVDLIAVSTNYTTGSNLTASLTVAGTPATNTSDISYVWLFGGDDSGTSTAWAFVETNNAYLHSLYLELPIPIGFTVSGSTVSISVETDLVGPSSGFTFNGEASVGDSSNTSTYSFLGTDYSGSGTCTGSSCTGGGTGSGSGGSPSSIPPGEIIWPVVIVVVVIVVVLLVRRRRKAATPAAPPVAGSAPPPPPPPN